MSDATFFLVIPTPAFGPLLKRIPNLDFSVDESQTSEFTLIHVEQADLDYVRSTLMEVGTQEDLAMFAHLLVVAIPHKDELPDGINYNHFLHNYMWAEIRKRNAIEQFQEANNFAQTLRDNPLTSLLQAIAGGLASMSGGADDEEDEGGPCDDPSCQFCHPETAFAKSEEESEEKPKAKPDESFVKTAQASPDAFFVDGSRSVH